MLILLPPSEGKSAPESGPRLRSAALSFPALASTRRTVLEALITLCRGDVDTAAAVLGLGPTQQGEVGVDARLRSEPCAPAIEIYTGVLYEALDATTLPPAGRRRLRESVAIASGLWGLVRPDDLIPAYRLSGDVNLPGIGPLHTVWRGPISSILENTPGLIVDMRSGVYTNLGPVPDEALGRAVTVRVLNERQGKRTVVSHNNKATKGRLVRSLVTMTRRPKDVTGLLDALEGEGYEVELNPGRRQEPPILDVILR
jgi:cytoplasmic iron level regulating protein YaaA (DUF328/UPF0246 family)